LKPALKTFVFLLAALLAASAQPSPAADSFHYEDSHTSMGTEFTVVAYGRDRAYLAEVVREVFEKFDRIDAQMSNYKASSELSQINREAARRAVVVEPKLFHLIQDSLRQSRESDGAFDITVGPLIKAWGFFRGEGRFPDEKELAEVMGHVGFRHVHLDAAQRTIRFDAEGIELDLGAIAKGYALDRAAEILRANGITQALISSGTSSLIALGSPPGERGWKVSIRDPFDKQRAADVILLKNYSLSVSGNYEKFFKLSGKVYSHILNPKTGRPVENMLSAAVLAPLGEMSDALSTTLYVLGVERSKEFLKTHANIIAIFYVSGNSEGEFRRVENRSPTFSVPSESLAEIDKQ
jgi:FAD:protein FMN transferase